MIAFVDVYCRWVPGDKGGESGIVLGAGLKARGNDAALFRIIRDRASSVGAWPRQQCPSVGRRPPCSSAVLLSL